jgi:tetratricopeptide (TPR) repeat protein
LSRRAIATLCTKTWSEYGQQKEVLMFSKKYISFVLLFLFMLASTSGYGQQSKDITYTSKSPEALRFFLEGIDLMDNFRYSEAATPLEKAVEADPEFALAYDNWSATAPTTEEALRRLNKAVDLASKASEPERLIILSDKALMENKPDVAKANLRRLVELLPDGKRAHYIYALFLDGQRQDVEADKEYNKTISLDPSFAAAYNNLAYFLARLGRYPEAVKALQKYVDLKPAEPNPHDSMGEIYLWMGDYDNSMKEYNSALKLDPDFVSSLAGLGHNLVFRGEFDKARAKYGEIRAFARSIADTNMAYYWEAVSYIHEKKLDDAISVLQQQINFARVNKDIYLEPGIHDEMAIIYREKGDYDKALTEVGLERQLAMKPEIDSVSRQGTLRGCLAMEAGILARQGKPDQARVKLDEYSKAVEGITDPAVIRSYHGSIGMAAFFGKDYQKAINELKQGDPLNQYNKYYLGLSYEMAGSKDLAKTVFSEIARYNRNGMVYAFVRPAASAKM